MIKELLLLVTLLLLLPAPPGLRGQNRQCGCSGQCGLRVLDARVGYVSSTHSSDSNQHPTLLPSWTPLWIGGLGRVWKGSRVRAAKKIKGNKGSRVEGMIRLFNANKQGSFNRSG